MPITGTESALGAALYSMVQAELSKTGQPPDPSSLKHLKAFCDGIAKGLIPHLTTNANVAPGLKTAGSPSAQATVEPGKII